MSSELPIYNGENGIRSIKFSHNGKNLASGDRKVNNLQYIMQ